MAKTSLHIHTRLSRAFLALAGLSCYIYVINIRAHFKEFLELQNPSLSLRISFLFSSFFSLPPLPFPSSFLSLKIFITGLNWRVDWERIGKKKNVKKLVVGNGSEIVRRVDVCVSHICSWPKKEDKAADVRRQDPDGATYYPLYQYPTTAAPQEDEEDDFDEVANEVAVADVGLQPSVTQMAPESLLPAVEDTPQQPLISFEQPSDGVASWSMEWASPDTALWPSQTSVFSQPQTVHRPVVGRPGDSYDRSRPLTTRAIQKLEQSWPQRQKTDTSSDEDRRKTVADSGGGYVRPVLRHSVTPGSVVTAADTLTPVGSSASTFLYDSESSDSGVGVTRPLTLQSIEKMKRRGAKKSSLNVEVTKRKPPVVVEPEKMTRSTSRRQTPQTIFNADTTLSTPAVMDVTSVPSKTAPQSSQPDRRTVSPARTVLPAGTAAVPGTQSTPAAESFPASVQAVPLNQSVQSEKMKDVEKTERTDAEGRKTTVYKLTPKAGSMYPAPGWPAFAAPSGMRSVPLDQAASGDHVPADSIRLDDASTSGAARVSGMRRSTDADQQTIHRLTKLASQRGENMSQNVLQEIQGTSAKPQVRAAGFAQVAALQEPMTRAAGEDISALPQLDLMSSAQERLTYTHLMPEEPQVKNYQRDVDEPLAQNVSDSLSNFQDLTGEHSHTEVHQRLSYGASVPDVNEDASRFLQCRFNSLKRCLRGLEDGAAQGYLNNIQYDTLQPETKSLLSHYYSNIGTGPEQTQWDSEKTILQSLSSHKSDQHLSPARPDYPQQPSSSKLAQLSYRLSFLPSDAAQPDEYLHPSSSKIAHSAVDFSAPDDFLHPSSHTVTVTDDAPHPTSEASRFAKYDEAQHPSLTWLQTKGTSQVPATLDDYLHSSLSHVQRKSSSRITGSQTAHSADDFSTPDDFLHPSSHAFTDDALHSSETKPTSDASRFAKYDEAQHPSLTWLQTSQVPAKLDEYHHPSLTRVQLKSSSMIAESQAAYSADDISTHDDFLHPSSHTVTVTGDALHPRSEASRFAKYDDPQHPSLTWLETKGTSQVPAKFDEYLHPSLSRIQPKSSSMIAESQAAAVDFSTPDDFLHPSSHTVSLPVTDDELPSSETKPTSDASRFAKYDDPQHPSLTWLQISQVPATLDDYLHPSLTRVQPKSGKLRTDIEETTTTTSAVDREYFLYNEPARHDDILHPSLTRIVSDDTRRRTSGKVEDIKYQSSKQTSTSDLDKIARTSYKSVPSRDRVLIDTATSTTGLGRKESLPTVPAIPDDILHPSSTRIPIRHKGASSTLDSAISTITGGKRETLLPVSEGTDAVQPRSTQVPPHAVASGRATLDTATSTTGLAMKESLPTVPARPDDILHPSSTQLPPRERLFSQRNTAQTSSDFTTSTTAGGMKQSDQAVSSRPGERIDFPSRGNAAATTDFKTTVPDRKETLPVSSRTDDVTYPPSTQFSPHDRVENAFDTTTSTRALDTQETLPLKSTGPDSTTYPSLAVSTQAGSTALPGMSVSARSDDILHPPSTRFPPPTTLDSTTATTALDSKVTLPVESGKPDDPLHASASQFERIRGTLDGATTDLDRNENVLSLPAKPVDRIHPSSTKIAPHDGARETSAVTTDGKEASLVLTRPSADASSIETSVAARPEDILHSSSRQFSEQDTTRGAFDRAATSPTAAAFADNRQTTQSDVVPTSDAVDLVPSSLQQSSSTQPSMDQLQTLPIAGHEASYPSEFVQSSLSGADNDMTTTDSAGRPSSKRITDQDMSEDRRRLSDRQSMAGVDGVQTGLRRSLMKSEQRQTVPPTPVTAPEQPDSTAPRRTVSWEPVPTSDVDTAPAADSVSSVDQQSPPNTIGSGGPSSTSTSSATSAPAAVTRDGSDVRTIETAATDSTTGNVVNARDSPVVIREQMTKKKMRQESLADEGSYDSTDEHVYPVDWDDVDGIQPDPARRSGGYVTPPRSRSSSETASALETGDEVAAADDYVPPRQQHKFDDESSSSSVVDFDKVDETEDLLLECRSASVSRPPPCRCLTTRLPCPRSASADICDETSHPCQTAGYVPCTRTPVNNTTQRSRFGSFVERDAPGRTAVCGRPTYTDCYSRQTQRYSRDYRSTDQMGVYQSPFARGYVQPTHRSHGAPCGRPCHQPCQPSRQPPSPQVAD